MNSIEDIFSEENLREYGGTCINIAMNIDEREESIDTLLIPSRGAVPIFLGVLYSLNRMDYAADLYKKIRVQKMIGTLSHIKGIDPNEKDVINVLLFPFTADLNMDKYSKRMGVKADNDEFTNKTRDYWAHVTSALFLGKKERKKDPYFDSFINLILREIEGRDELATFYENFPQITNMSMIDTVISGRASATILKSFDKIAKNKGNPNISPYAHLVVDANKKRLKKPYERFLEERKDWGKAKLYGMPNIVSEDKGASLEGVTAVVYPSIMDSSKNLRFNDQEFFIGAGSWYPVDGLRYQDHFNMFMDTIKSAIDTFFIDTEDENDEEKKSKRFEEKRNELTGLLKEEGILDKNKWIKDEYNIFKVNPKMAFLDNIYKTGSQVLHRIIPENNAKRLLVKFGGRNSIKYSEGERRYMTKK
ncbi:MAG: hypothetical protein KAU20_01635 [Nanoarchaeota archaeon]|nr:hypothetical protein [Nanoarchaeota archaeon]